VRVFSLTENLSSGVDGGKAFWHLGEFSRWKLRLKFLELRSHSIER